MARRRTRLRKLAYFLIAIVVLPLVFMPFGTIIPRPFVVEATAETGDDSRSVLLLYNPIHTDIAFPADPDVLDKLDFLRAAGLPIDHTEVAWIILGWGGRSFYLETPTWANLKPLPVFKALTVDKSVMHVALAGEMDAALPQVDELVLSGEQFDNMLARALAGFAADSDGEPQVISGAGYGEFDRFYEANGRFNAIVGCNT